MASREIYLRNRIRQWLLAEGAEVVTIHGGAFGKRGTADLIACLAGRYIAIETKAAKGVAAKIQKVRLERVRRAGGIALIARNLDEVKEAIQQADDTIRFSEDQRPTTS